MKPLIYIFVLASSLSTYAQSVLNPFTSNLVWEYSTVTIDSTPFSLRGKFITHGKGKVEWIQNDSNENPFTVSRVTGKWKNSSDEGVIVFNVQMDASSGTIEFKRESQYQNVNVMLTMNNPGRKSTSFKFVIDTVNAL